VSPGEECLDEWRRVFDLNLWSATNVIEAAKDALIASKGVIICISSICGLEVIPGAPLTYSAAKAALNIYVRGVARHLGKHGVRVNAVAPGNILFDESVWEKRMAQDLRVVEEMLKNNVSLNKLGSPEDVANIVAWLASSRSKFVTGQIWTVDGGQIRS